ncbi:MAG: alpha-amylase family glycosyl hydrolase, partial [Fimbriimonadaceae bacterium]|nr:alpha-amylase family glycosyl hydrolase [Fimbriimonadaceae bacterium]
MAASIGLSGHEFHLPARPGVDSVHVAGTFNRWSATADPMKLDAQGTRWSLRVPLRPGRHLYKFVLNGREWITDPANAELETDESGNRNSVLFVVEPEHLRPRVGDGRIDPDQLEFRPERPWLSQDRGRLVVRLQTRHGDIQAAAVVTAQGRTPMEPIGQDGFVARWEAAITPAPGLRFELTDGAGTQLFGSGGLGSRTEFPVPDPGPAAADPPVWPAGKVLYQIFPDRFFNADFSTDRADTVPWEAAPSFGNRFGGDLRGIQTQADYLQKLGIDVLYLNPIFASPSNHRYDTTDYFRIDPVLGGDADLASLTRDLERRGIRTLLDGVFNHTATDHFAFQSLVKDGESSRYR